MTEMMLEAAERTSRGKGGVRKLRQQGIVPGIVYGRGEPLPVQVAAKQAERLVHALHGGERLIGVRFANGETRSVIMKEVQTTATGGRLLHIDFHEIDVTKTVVVTVEVRAVGHSDGVRLGGILQTITREVDVECLPTDIPEYLDADLTPLKIGDNFHVRDLVLPQGLRLVTSPDETLFVVSAQITEEEEKAREEAAVEAEEIRAAVPAAEGEPAPAVEKAAE
ncbi:MAG: 50S ribosomal protein L25 [Candidatus Lambdaproteobacteria bacterium]|nr:50S ribosomal protein L25 [Candidatus Lambdaproteobacteria bacterium]